MLGVRQTPAPTVQRKAFEQIGQRRETSMDGTLTQISVENIQKTLADFFDMKVVILTTNAANFGLIETCLAQEFKQEIGGCSAGATTPPCCTQ